MATATAASPPVPKRLVVSTYRQLLRLALRLDLDPALRSLVCVAPSAIYSPDLGCWRGLARNPDIAPAEQYLEDVLRFANQTSDFFLADPECVATREAWRVSNQLYPARRFVSPEDAANSNNSSNSEEHQNQQQKQQQQTKGNQFDAPPPQTKTSIQAQLKETFTAQHYPLAYLTRLHFRGGPELTQFKTEMQRAVREAHLRRGNAKGFGAETTSSSTAAATSASATSTTTASSSSSAAAAAAASPQQQQQQPSAAQLGAGFHAVRWMRNILQVVRPDHPSLAARFPSSTLFGEDDANTTAATATPSANDGELEFVPCYRSPLRRRWRLGSDEPIPGEEIEEQAVAAAAAAAKKKSTAEEADDDEEDSTVVVDDPTETPKERATRLLRRARDKQLKRSKAAAAAAAATPRRSEKYTVASNILGREYTDTAGHKWADVPTRVTGHAPSAFFLCAHPVMPGFFLGNILLIQHLDPQQGAIGFTINRPLRNNDGVPVPVWAVFSEEAQAPSSVLRQLEDNRIFVGGPVSVSPQPPQSSTAASRRGGSSSEQNEREQAFMSVAHFLHRIPDVPFAQPVVPGVWWGGDERVISQKLENKEASPRDVMVLIGHAAWGPQQLEGEISNGSWITAVSRSPQDDKLHEQSEAEGTSRSPFVTPPSSLGSFFKSASSSSSSAAAAKPEDAVPEGKTTETKKDEQPQAAEGTETASTAPRRTLVSRFDTAADFIFATNLPVSKEERVFECQQEPDSLVHAWKELVRRLGSPGLTRLTELAPDGSWMASVGGDAKGGKPMGPGAAARARAASGATGAGGNPGGSVGSPNV